MIASKPIQRFELDGALGPIRDDAGIVPRDSARQESLLLVRGNIEPSSSYFCRQPVQRRVARWTMPRWTVQPSRLFVLEVWSHAGAEALRTSARPAEGAPSGVYLCNMTSAGSAKIALYGVVPEALADEARRSEAFAYLTARANAFLKP
jgi:hypothetical protein